MRTTVLERRYIPLFLGLMAHSWIVPHAYAADVNLAFQPRIDVGIANYSLDFGSTAQLFGDSGLPEQVTTTKLNFSVDMPTAGVGITAFADRFYLDVYAEGAFDGSVSDSNSILTNTPASSSTTQVRYKSDLTRNEYAVTAGYGISDTTSVFAGWKWARTDVEGVKGTGIARSFDGTALGSFQTFGDYEFKYDGPFVGAAIGWPIAYRSLEGSLSLNVAVAFLDGDLKVSSGVGTLSGVPVRSPGAIFNTSGDAIGTTIGLSWRGATAVQGLSYSLGVKAYQYDFDADDSGKADIGETLVQLKAGLAYAF